MSDLAPLSSAESPPTSVGLLPWLRWAGLLLFVFAMFLPGILLASDRYWLPLFTRYMALALFALSVDLVWGYTGLLTLGQSFIRTKPVAERSIVFLALTGAESGLLGSEYYVEHPVFPLGETAAVLNLDTLHGGGPTRDVTVFGFGNTDLEEYARAMALLQGRVLTPDPTPELGLYFRSDNFTFAEAGVPALDLIDFNFGPDNAYWHTPQDTMDKLGAHSFEVIGNVLMKVIPELEAEK